MSITLILLMRTLRYREVSNLPEVTGGAMIQSVTLSLGPTLLLILLICIQCPGRLQDW